MSEEVRIKIAIQQIHKDTLKIANSLNNHSKDTQQRIIATIISVMKMDKKMILDLTQLSEPSNDHA